MISKSLIKIDTEMKGKESFKWKKIKTENDATNQ